ncbi:MAG TPA: surface-adhesin E family protein [Burkholderiales bacterium]|nr:surface-adhesin E family protein [Burkholderiales bacterium]
MRVVLALSLMLAAAPLRAEWLKVGETDTADHYIDTATIRGDGNLRRVWTVQDMREADASGVRSIRALEEYDCAAGRFRYLSLTAHSGPMAGGLVIAAHDLDDTWSARPPGTSPSAIERIVCH